MKRGFLGFLRGKKWDLGCFEVKNGGLGICEGKVAFRGALRHKRDFLRVLCGENGDFWEVCEGKSGI